MNIAARRRRYASLVIATVTCFLAVSTPSFGQDSLIESVSVSSIADAPSDNTYWMHARAGIIPAGAFDPPTRAAQGVIVLQKSERKGNHLYHGLSAFWTEDLGKTWSSPERLPEGERHTTADGLLDTPCDMTPRFHTQSGKLLVTGATFLIDKTKNRDLPGGASNTAYLVYDPKTRKWDPWKSLEMPDKQKFHFARAGCTQRVDLPSGEILLPIYFVGREANQAYATVLRCKFDGTTLTYLEHGDELTINDKPGYRGRGFHEPSLTKFGDKYYLTLRATERAYVAVSDDGLHFSEPKVWSFDDGTELASINTQQHWITHSEGLFLGYTKLSADNREIMRGRAPLYIAQVDPDRLVLNRDTEQILLPNLGDAFGNFGVCHVDDRETWIVDCLVRAAAGKPSVYLAKIRWSKPNR
jgi:hypothetical protein